ncbi:unnamed protein product [Closterium sp. NIES-53]
MWDGAYGGGRSGARGAMDEQQATGDGWAVEEQEGGAAVLDFGTGVQQQEGGAAAQEGGVRGQQQEGVVAAQEGGAGGQEHEGEEAAQERRVSEYDVSLVCTCFALLVVLIIPHFDYGGVSEYDVSLVCIRKRHRTASGSGQAGPSTAGHSTSAIASEGQVVELLQRVAEVEASQKKLVADVFAKHSEQAAVFNNLAGDFRTAWNMISESSKSTMKQCGDAINGVMEEMKPLEGACTKLDEMSGKIIEGVAAAITKAGEDAVEKQLKLLADWKSSPKRWREGFRGSAGPSMRSRQVEWVAGVRSGVERRVHERLVPPSSSVGGHVGSPVASPPSRARQTVGKSVEDKEVIVLDQSPLQQTSEVASAGKGAVEKRGAPTLSGGAAGKGAGEKRGAPSQVVVAAGLLSKTKAGSAAQLGIVGRPVEPVGKRLSSVLGNVCLSEPGSPPPGLRPRSPSASKKTQAVTKSTKRAAEAIESSDVEKASTVVAARHEKSKKSKVIGYAPPPPPDDQAKTRGCKAPFKGPGMMSRKGKPVSEQTVGLRTRFLGTFETEADQKFCTAICWRVYFPDIDLKEYEGFTAQDEKDWKVYLDAAVRMPTRGLERGARTRGMSFRRSCRLTNAIVSICSFRSLLATTNTEVRARTDWGIALCVAIGKVATLGRRHRNVIYPVPKNMHGTAHMMAVAATVASLWAACRKLSREDIKKDALAAANAALYAPEMATRASAAAMAALLFVLLHVGKTFPAKQWPDLLYSSAVEGLGSTDTTLLQMVRVAAQLLFQYGIKSYYGLRIYPLSRNMGPPTLQHDMRIFFLVTGRARGAYRSRPVMPVALCPVAPDASARPIPSSSCTLPIASPTCRARHVCRPARRKRQRRSLRLRHRQRRSLHLRHRQRQRRQQLTPPPPPSSLSQLLPWKGGRCGGGGCERPAARPSLPSSSLYCSTCCCVWGGEEGGVGGMREVKGG